MTEDEARREAAKDSEALKILGGSVVAFIIIGFIVYSMQADLSVVNVPAGWQLDLLEGRHKI